MTHPAELEADVEIPTDFTSHLAERLQLAPDTVREHLEIWLAHYPRTERVARGLVKAEGRLHELRLLATAG